MTTITAADLATVRRRSGDNNNSPYDVQDSEIDAIYVDTMRGNLNLRSTSFYVLIERLGIATNAVAVSSPLGGSTRNQKFDQIMRLLQTFYASELAAFDYSNLGESGFAEWSLNSGTYSP